MPQKSSQLAKLTRPRLFNAVARERLFARLDHEHDLRPAIFVVGPPGAGKTTLIASWLYARKLQGIWYQIDPGDGDVATFFYYLRQGATAFSRKGQSPLPLLTPEYLPDIPGFSRRFFRDLIARLPDGATLVLDNYQEVVPDQQLHRLVADAVTEMRQSISLIAITRRDPPECYARLRANENLAFFGWEDLKLDLKEAAAIANSRGVADAARIRTILARADGWAAGVILMLESAKHGSACEALGSEERVAAFDYFASQIFEQLNERERNVLMQSALIPTISADLACAISGEPTAGELLDNMYRQRLFTDRRDGRPPQYQFHALFREFLLQQLMQREPVDRYRELKRRAAALLESAGRMEEAIPLYGDAEDMASVVRLILELAPRVLSQGRWRTLQEWIRALPEAQVQANPWLLYWLGMAEMEQQRFEGARQLLALAFHLHGQAGGALGQLLAAAAILRAYYVEFNDFEPMDPWIDRVDELLRGAPHFPSPRTELNVYSALLAACMQRQLSHPRLQEAVDRVTSLLNADLDANMRIAAATPLMAYHTYAMQLPRGQAVVERIEPLLRSPELTALNRAFWWALVGYHRFRCGQRAEAERALDEADRVSTEHGITAPQFLSHIFRAYNCATWGDLSGAVSALDGLEKWLSPTRPMNAVQFHQAWYVVALLREDGAEAARHGLLGLEAAAKIGAPFFDVVWSIGAAAGLAMAGEHEEAERYLARAWNKSEGTFLVGYRVNMMMVRAYSALSAGKRAEAHACIREMLVLGRRNDSWRYLQPVPTVREIVLEEALAAGIEIEFVQHIARSFELSPRRPDLVHWPWRVKVYTLGRFEVLVDDKPLVLSRKSPRRPLSLLKMVIALGGLEVPQAKLIDALWTDDEGDAAHHDFDVALYRMRKLLNDPKALLFEDGRVSINARLCWVDTLDIEKRFDQLEQLLKEADELGITACLHAIARLYRGVFLPAEADAPWSVSMRERLRGRFVQAVQRVARRFEASGRWEEAIAWYTNGRNADDLAEAFYQGLMRCYLETGQRAQGLLTYRRLRECLAAGLDVPPSPSSEALRRALETG